MTCFTLSSVKSRGGSGTPPEDDAAAAAVVGNNRVLPLVHKKVGFLILILGLSTWHRVRYLLKILLLVQVDRTLVGLE